MREQAVGYPVKHRLSGSWRKRKNTRTFIHWSGLFSTSFPSSITWDSERRNNEQNHTTSPHDTHLWETCVTKTQWISSYDRNTSDNKFPDLNFKQGIEDRQFESRPSRHRDTSFSWECFSNLNNFWGWTWAWTSDQGRGSPRIKQRSTGRRPVERLGSRAAVCCRNAVTKFWSTFMVPNFRIWLYWYLHMATFRRSSVPSSHPLIHTLLCAPQTCVGRHLMWAQHSTDVRGGVMSLCFEGICVPWGEKNSDIAWPELQNMIRADLRRR